MMIVWLTACGSATTEDANKSGFSGLDASKREGDQYLAYEHFITIDVKEEDLSRSYTSTLEKCIAEKENDCTILDSNISKGTHPSATIRLRIQPEGAKDLIQFVSNMGKVIRESTHVEDLAKPIIDNEQRLKMLQTHRDRLVALQKKAGDDIDSLIKISSELSRVQSDLEKAMGENEYLLRRVNLDIVNIQFQVELSRSFWKPISRSLSNFMNHLSDGISITIIAVAYLFPGIILFGVVFVSIRYFRKKIRNRLDTNKE